ncbi:type II toxin-antitoxin system VapC family toxin [Nitrospirillum sp. BR 11164]|uniref:type II toxin-antitoxin system VapC family toxin n=1 Tax=Nitrospirillum sp. BR 11164 TaxID=3104324 RepID=UPI002AFE3148|nr:type II toxin-antitoxin system VapC family toxin [Nitrospirillum sp. BR 11164]MEA1647962.1 type II toxin-antitoxin system VapC family toxin [Nitrospirillum sp. BR 11164]
MIILDTNVLSELMRPAPSDAVLRWLMGQASSLLFTTTITQAEILSGIALLPKGRRRAGLENAALQMFVADFAGRILPFDTQAAISFAGITTARRQAGRPISALDAQIAAIAHSLAAAVATRNIDDFSGCGVPLINPWTA